MHRAIESKVSLVKSPATLIEVSGPKRAHFSTICEVMSCISDVDVNNWGIGRGPLTACEIGKIAYLGTFL